MRPVRYSINITLDGCCDHAVGVPNEDTHRHSADLILAADALILGRVIYQMMEAAWRPVVEGERPDWVLDWMVPFAQAIHAVKKYVVSDTLGTVDWNAEIVRGRDLEQTVRALKQEPGNGLLAGGVALPLALAEHGLIDEYEFVVQPRIAGRGPTVFAGLSSVVDLRLVGRKELDGGVLALRYQPVAGRNGG
ncbi:MAG: dihydrofolate reductase family protein [Devosia sp.]|nr:dihydrofolate reductase family protein [Devosia sp.]